jgi:hypothetical protein
MDTDNLATEIAFAADTQEPMWVEALFLKSHQNVKATALVLDDILRRHPRTLYLLGDVVNLGYRKRPWKKIDKYLDNCRIKGMEVHAILGNHDVMGRPKKGERNFQQRFATHVRTGYVHVTDSVAVVMLNSNFGTISPADLQQQQDWYESTLTALDAHPEVAAVVVTCHHPPFTNSRLVQSSKMVQQRFVPAYLASKKACLFITGHSHAFEHFRHEQKDFLVIGGGGGLRHPLDTSEKRRPDLSGNYKPLFHYLVIRKGPQELIATSFALKADFSHFEEGYELKFPLQDVVNDQRLGSN